MNWESIYLTCFITGLLLTAASFIFGAHFHIHLPVHLHLPAGAHLPTIHGPRGHTSSPMNLTVLLMFLTWFGGAGYLMTHSHNAAATAAFTVAAGAGFTGGALMYLFTARVFMANEKPLREEDFEMVGVIGRVSSSIRATGTGELIYTQQGTRRSCGARSEDGRAIERGAEVVVMDYEKGIAYVRRFEELHGQA
jgi:membrane protein implicated in regulation of membrane protease activity